METNRVQSYDCTYHRLHNYLLFIMQLIKLINRVDTIYPIWLENMLTNWVLGIKSEQKQTVFYLILFERIWVIISS